MLTNEKKRDNAHSHSGVRVVSDHGHVVIGVRIVLCYHAIMDVVIGVRIMQCYHAIMSISDFSTFGPNFNLFPISTCCQTVFCDRQFSSVANYCTLLHRENGSFEVLSLHTPSVTIDRRQL